MTDRELGLKVFKSFWNWSRAMNRSSFSLSFDDFLKVYGSKTEVYLDGIGGGIREANVSDSTIDSAMRSMAIASNGKVPKNPLKMIDYLSNESVKIDWTDAVVFTAKESAGDILKGAESVGNQILLTGKILNWLLPVIVLVFVLYWINKNTNGMLGKASKKVLK